MPKQPKWRWEESMSLPRAQLTAQCLPSFCGVQRFPVPCFVIAAVFLFFPCDLPIISLVANDPGKTRDVSIITPHLHAWHLYSLFYCAHVFLHIVHPAASITYLHGKVGDESWSRDLHLKHSLSCLRSAVHHRAGHRGESIARNDCGFHTELRHPRPGFLLVLKGYPLTLTVG